MAREAYRSLYGALTKLKDDSLLKDPAAGAGDDNDKPSVVVSTDYTNFNIAEILNIILI